MPGLITKHDTLFGGALSYNVSKTIQQYNFTIPTSTIGYTCTYIFTAPLLTYPNSNIIKVYIEKVTASNLRLYSGTNR